MGGLLLTSLQDVHILFSVSKSAGVALKDIQKFHVGQVLLTSLQYRTLPSLSFYQLICWHFLSRHPICGVNPSYVNTGCSCPLLPSIILLEQSYKAFWSAMGGGYTGKNFLTKVPLLVVCYVFSIHIARFK